jgi:methylated-DNA-[protein]-cysteine S-methyltransferase
MYRVFIKLNYLTEICTCVNEFGLLDSISQHNLGKNMRKPIKYVIFRTKWGYFGLAGTEFGLLRTFLPHSNPEKVKFELLKGLTPLDRVSLVRRSFSEGGRIEFDKIFFKEIQQQIIAYFEGACVNFSPDIPVMLDGFGRFYKSVLTACRHIRFGQTATYGELAKKSARPAAARAVGNALSKNPLPLIIPCHRVIRSDGSLGGFSAPGGLLLKGKLLVHEQNCLSAAL